MARFSVWLGTECLGYSALEVDGRRPNKRRGAFEPTIAGEALGPLVQTRASHLPGAPVVQHRMPRAEEWRSLPSTAWAIDVAVGSSAPPQETTGLSADEQLQLRDANGTVVPGISITILQRPALPQGIPAGDPWQLIVELESTEGA